MQTAFEEVVGIPFIYMQVVQCKKKKNGMKCHVDIWSIPTCVGILCSSWVVGKWPNEIFLFCSSCLALLLIVVLDYNSEN